MKKVIYNIILVGSLLLSIYAIYIWLYYEEYNVTPVEQKLLVSASFLSVLGLIIVYIFQKKGYLNYKFIHFLLFLFSVVFLFGSSFLLYTSYDTYVKRSNTQKTNGAIEIMTHNTSTYQEDEAQIYLNLKDNRNRLLGYENFFIETAQNYNPSDYSYANTLKTTLVNQLATKKGTQPYWDAILSNVYAFDSIDHSHKRGGYDIMYAFSNKAYPHEDLGDTKDMDLINQTSISQYWQTELLEINREPEHINSYWRNNKAFLYTFFSKSRYDALCKKIVDDLIAIKTKINEQHNYKAFYQKYNVTDPVFLTFPNRKFVKSYDYSWPFSFWDRRFEEGNDDVVFEILKEIQMHYRN